LATVHDGSLPLGREFTLSDGGEARAKWERTSWRIDKRDRFVERENGITLAGVSWADSSPHSEADL
jgi:hypothetical protein